MKVFRPGAFAFFMLIGAMPSHAADMPMKAPPLVAVYSWTGWYAGVNVGYSWGRSETDVAYFTSPGGVPIVPPPGSIVSGTADLDGWIGGGQIGGNLQNGNWVVGLEADIQWSGQKGSSDFLCAATIIGGPCFLIQTLPPPGVTGATLSLDQKLLWFGTVRGRLGWTPSQSWLAYVTGGLAYGEIKTDAALTGFVPAATLATASSSTTKAGWTVGVGLEGVISGRWTGKIEYLYMDLGTVSGSVVNTPAGIQATYSSDITDNIIRVGLNYRFKP